jgi:hypothetical protein
MKVARQGTPFRRAGVLRVAGFRSGGIAVDCLCDFSARLRFAAKTGAIGWAFRVLAFRNSIKMKQQSIKLRVGK